jgi:hypothetical protein
MASIPNIIPTIKPKIFIPIWLYKWLALMPFIGFFGFDHWAIDSKFTGIAKLFVNLFTFGSWYAYDIVQAWNGIRADKKTLQSDGLDIPFFEGFNIGKGKFDAEPITNMSNNSQMWLLILFIGLFAFIYYILGFFLTSKSGFLISSLASITFYGIFALSAYTIFFYIMNRTAKGTSFTSPKTTTEAKQGLYSSYGVVNPLSVRQSTSRVGSVLSSVTPSLTLPKMSGGGNGLSDLVETLKKMEPKPINIDHLYFLGLLVVLPVSGFIAYGLIKNKKRVEKDEVS